MMSPTESDRLLDIASLHLAIDDQPSASARSRNRVGAAEPMTALNPVARIEPQITDVLHMHLTLDRHAARVRALELLRAVHLREPERLLRQYPHELSGGMRQRVLIAIAFACKPRLIIADEPTTALDVTVERQILRLLKELQQSSGTAVLFITHDLGVVSKICDDALHASRSWISSRKIPISSSKRACVLRT